MASEGNTNDSAANAAVEIIRQLLGSRIICTLADGRRAEGKLICVDRLYVKKLLKWSFAFCVCVSLATPWIERSVNVCKQASMNQSINP